MPEVRIRKGRTDTGEVIAPRVGDIVTCAYCGAVSHYKPLGAPNRPGGERSLRLRWLTPVNCKKGV